MIMEPGTYNLSIIRGVDLNIPLQLVTEAGVAIDLRGRTFYAQIRDNSGEPLISNITVTATSLINGEISLGMTKTATAGIDTRAAKWDLLSDASGTVEGPWLVGAVSISGTITQIT